MVGPEKRHGVATDKGRGAVRKETWRCEMGQEPAIRGRREPAFMRRSTLVRIIAAS
jgi:hypothetical protein